MTSHRLAGLVIAGMFLLSGSLASAGDCSRPKAQKSPGYYTPAAVSYAPVVYDSPAVYSAPTYTYSAPAVTYSAPVFASGSFYTPTFSAPVFETTSVHRAPAQRGITDIISIIGAITGALGSGPGGGTTGPTTTINTSGLESKLDSIESKMDKLQELAVDRVVNNYNAIQSLESQLTASSTALEERVDKVTEITQENREYIDRLSKYADESSRGIVLLQERVFANQRALMRKTETLEQPTHIVKENERINLRARFDKELDLQIEILEKKKVAVHPIEFDGMTPTWWRVVTKEGESGVIDKTEFDKLTALPPNDQDWGF